jgi:hypothetical protein
MGIFPKAKFDEKHLIKAIDKYEADRQRIAHEKEARFREILNNEGEIMRAKARIQQLHLEKNALEKAEGKVEARLEMLGEILNEDA